MVTLAWNTTSQVKMWCSMPSASPMVKTSRLYSTIRYKTPPGRSHISTNTPLRGWKVSTQPRNVNSLVWFPANLENGIHYWGEGSACCMLDISPGKFFKYDFPSPLFSFFALWNFPLLHVVWGSCGKSLIPQNALATHHCTYQSDCVDAVSDRASGQFDCRRCSQAKVGLAIEGRLSYSSSRSRAEVFLATLQLK